MTEVLIRRPRYPSIRMHHHLHRSQPLQLAERSNVSQKASLRNKVARQGQLHRKLCRSPNSHISCLFAFWFLLHVARPALAQMTLQITNHNSAYNASNVYFRFGGADSISGTIDGQPIQLGTSYSISQIGSGIQITRFTGGAKIFIALGASFSSGDAGNNYNPNFANASLGDYYTRWDKVELSYVTTDPSSVANLTADDFASIPMRLTAGGASVGWHLTNSMNALLAQLAALSGNDPQAIAITNSQIVRVMSPHTAFYANWPSLQPYIDYVRSNAIVTHVVGAYDGRAPFTLPEWQQQSYDLTAFVDSATNLVLTGTCGIVGATTITISSQELLEAIYSASPNYVVNGVYANNSNSVFDAIVRDALAGFNLGLVGTSRIDPRTGSPFTNESTQVWYNYPQNGTVTESLRYTNVFAALWGADKKFYNQYAAILSDITDAYGFPYNDTLAKPLLPLVNNPTLTLEILPDEPPPGGEVLPIISNIAATNGAVALTITRLDPGISYSVERSTDLRSAGAWETVMNFVASGSDTNYIETLVSSNAFFRVRSQTP